MRFQTPLQPATLLRRYKRFLSDIRLEDGREVTAHVANPGAMTGLAEPGMRVWIEPNDDPKRKLKWAWKLSEIETGARVLVDTAIANRVVREALEAGRVPGMGGYVEIRPEQRYGAGSRVDFLLRGPDRPDCYVEVKSATLARQTGAAEFPDTVTARGARHLAELAEVARGGARAVLLYLVARTDACSVAVAADIDPAYAEAFSAARDAGVETLALGCAADREGVTVAGPLPVLGL
ncbi:DNA/RNA nuclease SfsA [Litorisediminicola beolgyonensis]|uniref:Sugar fermentation stimulation protein homolog n=1 Tax=Litorisediminicola beolgyonensis TaxID=1173614 RepID=A0ABW3ZI15_9RHOB